jgi:hypothetical protein
VQVIASPGTVLRHIGRSSLNPFAFARTCYDHLAGKLGVEVTSALERQKIIRPAGKAFEVTDSGLDWLDELQIDWRQLKLEKREFALQCLDFTERRPHLAGAVGSALCARMIALGWLVKSRVRRSVRLTAEGRMELSKRVQLEFTTNGVQSGGDHVYSKLS